MARKKSFSYLKKPLPLIQKVLIDHIIIIIRLFIRHRFYRNMVETINLRPRQSQQNGRMGGEYSLFFGGKGQFGQMHDIPLIFLQTPIYKTNHPYRSVFLIHNEWIYRILQPKPHIQYCRSQFQPVPLKFPGRI